MKKNELVQKIEHIRQQMTIAALQFGFTHQITINYSQELDSWLNVLEKTKLVKVKSK
jgi:Spo0E like sporulation regulatory protein